MANATSTQIQELYVAYFGRAADPAGLDYWVSAGVSQAYFASVMHAQAEFQDAYGSSSTENQVNQIYKNLFNREADADGLSYWTNQINNGVLKVAEIATHLIWAAKNNSGSSADLTALNNRSAAAVAYTAEVKASTAAMTAYQPLSTSPWSSGVNIQEAQDYLLTINGTTAHTAAGVTASVDVIEANGTPAAAQAFVLTTSADTFTGGNGNDTFNGVANQIDNDTFNGGRGTDTLTFTVSALDNNSSFTSTLIENIKIRATGVATIDFGDVTGTDSLEVNRTTSNLTLENIREIDPITLDRLDDGANAIFTYKSQVIEGTSDAITITLENSANRDDANAATGVVRVDGIETVNLVSISSPQYDRDDATENGNQIILDNAGSGTATEVVNISGAGDLTLTATDALTINNSASGEVDLTGTVATTYTHTGTGLLRITTGVADSTTTASGTGALNFTDSVAGDTTVTGSSGDDTFNFLAALDTDDVIVGGTGTDTLTITGDSVTVTAGSTGELSVSGVEVLHIDTDDANTNLDFDNFSNPSQITHVEIDGDAAAVTSSDAVVLTDTQATTFTINNDNTAAGDNLVSVTVDLKTQTGTQAITVNLNQIQDGTATFNDAFQLTTGLTANGVETITINADAIYTDDDTTTAGTGNAADDITIATLTSSTISTLNVAGDADLTITAALDSDLDTLNASSSTGDNTFTLSAGAQTITGGSGIDTINFGTSYTTADSFDGGAGDDVMTATWNSGNNTPTGISNVELLASTFTGGSLNATNLSSVTTHRLVDQSANASYTNLASTATTINQRGDDDTTNRANTFSYATGAAATVTYNNANASESVTNASTTFANVSNLTIAADDSAVGSSFTFATGAFSGGSEMTNLTLTTGSDSDDTLTLGAITAANLEYWTITADDANLTTGAYATAGELKTLTMSNANTASLGDLIIGDIGATGAADELTAFSVITTGTADDAGATLVNMGVLDAEGANFTFKMDLDGNYGASDIDTVTGTTISSIDIDTGTLGTSLTVDNFDVAGDVGTVDINVGDGFEGADNFIDAAGLDVGNFTLTSRALALNIADADSEASITVATTVGDVGLHATAAAASINLGFFEHATTVGDLSFTGTGSITWDGAAAATTFGNISGSVASGETVDLTTEDAASLIGTTAGTVGTTTVTGAGTFNVDFGAATTVGNIDLSGMDATTSASTITLNSATTSGLTYTGSSGGDTFVSGSGADTITAGLGADTITGGDGADTIDLTEATAAIDTVIITDDDQVDTISGFTVTGADDVISIDVSAIEAETSDIRANNNTDVAASDTVLIQEIGTGVAALAATDVTDNSNIIKFTDTDNNAFDNTTFSSTTAGWQFTLDNATGAATDVFMALAYDLDGGFASFGYVTDAGSNTDATFTSGTAVFTELAQITMTAAEFTALDANNFAFS